MMRGNGSYSLDYPSDERATAALTPSIKQYLFTLLVLFLLLGWLPYFDYNRFLPPAAASVELQCRLTSLELLAFKPVEAHLTLPHLTREGEWGAPLPLSVPSALLRRHVHCDPAVAQPGHHEPVAREYVYNRLLPNVSGLVDLQALLLEERARYEQVWPAWNYAGGAMRGFREYPLDEHGLCDRPVERDEDWLTVYLLIKAALLCLTVPLAWLLLFLMKRGLRSYRSA
jgi:hypothetical protein